MGRKAAGMRAGAHAERCARWEDLIPILQKAREVLQVRPGELLWFRGCSASTHKLLPSLMRDTEKMSEADHDQAEQDIFFEFQARAGELRERGLSEWEYLFFARHYGLPTRVIDWTDTFGVALYFALENCVMDQAIKGDDATIWVMNPYTLNEKTWGHREIVLPRYLGWIDEDYWDFGELLADGGRWPWDGPVALYPIQANERVRAQRGWFTIHGNYRTALEEQVPDLVWKIVLEPACIDQALEFLELAGFNRFSIYPDPENLAKWLRHQNLKLAGKK